MGRLADVGYQFCNICSKQTHCYCNQYYTKKLSYHVYTSFAYPLLHLVGHGKYKQYEEHVSKQPKQNVDIGIFGAERE